ncbi:hypothetical protein NUW54_g14591 [Trametes sanguinea]|uniref:Uncharacterized protein n=1 Tax=Trametes sanguinea TaxID=158606 RepID=A0ACC1MBZ0_9APHY|nr:hypothetical protein NUW54_g14591 [Trametes sanguinea]
MLAGLREQSTLRGYPPPDRHLTEHTDRRFHIHTARVPRAFPRSPLPRFQALCIPRHVPSTHTLHPPRKPDDAQSDRLSCGTIARNPDPPRRKPA